MLSSKFDDGDPELDRKIKELEEKEKQLERDNAHLQTSFAVTLSNALVKEGLDLRGTPYSPRYLEMKQRKQRKQNGQSASISEQPKSASQTKAAKK